MILSSDDCRQFSITMYLEIFRRQYGHWNYKGYLKARSVVNEFMCFLKAAILMQFKHISLSCYYFYVYI